VAQVKVGSTDPELLRRIRALRDNPAWSQFFALYEPLVAAWCSEYGFDSESVDELRQRVWVEMAQRMPSYQYDPGRSFRGWLRRFCHHRAVDMFRERRDRSFEVRPDTDLIDERWVAASNTIDDDEILADKLILMQEAREVQDEVRRKVKPVRWEVFWRVVIDGESISETAASLGLKYITAYAGLNHVAQLLRAEGTRRWVELGLDVPSNPKKGR
jgi:RNA polymerase sigma factor (sigma-70 family)